MENFVGFLEKNWAAISAAPWVFLTLAILLGGGGFFAGRLWYSDKIGDLQARIDLLNDRLADRDEQIVRLKSGTLDSDESPPNGQSGETNSPEFHTIIRGANFFDFDNSSTGKSSGIIVQIALWNNGGSGTIVGGDLEVQVEGQHPEVLKPRSIASQLRLSGDTPALFRTEDSIFEKIKGSEVGRTPIEGVIMFNSGIDRESLLNENTRLRLLLRDNNGGIAAYETSVGEL